MRLLTAYFHPNAHTDAISSSINKHEKAKLIMPRVLNAVSHSGPSLSLSHLNRFKMKSELSTTTS
jgi:hypothetical protein